MPQPSIEVIARNVEMIKHLHRGGKDDVFEVYGEDLYFTELTIEPLVTDLREALKSVGKVCYREVKNFTRGRTEEPGTAYYYRSTNR